MITADDAKKILIQVATKHSFHLDSMIAAAGHVQGNADGKRRSEISTGWAFRLFAAQGLEAKVGPNETREMQAAGLDVEMIEGVSKTMSFLRDNGFARPGRPVIEAILRENGIAAVDVHIRQAEVYYLRGMSAALLNTERRWSGVRPDDVALLQAALMEGATVNAVPASTAAKPNPVSNVTLNTAVGAPLSPGTAALPSSTDDPELDDEDEVDDAELEADQPGLIALVTQASDERVASKEWDVKTGRQHIALAKLFVRFVGHDNPSKMRQAHIANFKSIFYKMPKNYGKSPKDFIISVAEILKRAEDLPVEQRGFSTSTINRHMTQMGNIVGICKHAGYPFGNYEGVSGLRSRKRGDVRGERGKFSTEEVRTIFRLPIWNGSTGEEDRYSPGDLVIHDAAYWVPIIAALAGARREEICGLLVDDVELNGDFDLPCLRIESSTVRRLKNTQSKRRVPIHPELLRLGFVEYVQGYVAWNIRCSFRNCARPRMPHQWATCSMIVGKRCELRPFQMPKRSGRFFIPFVTGAITR
ncbi:hypothetical protein [Pararhizobium sp. LjRoot238]|uniref:hypothetical protein n=1 Tax=Pararhizobium sp. LjRoot238 TaxID=3342293 RepID=UPI003ECF1D6E